MPSVERELNDRLWERVWRAVPDDLADAGLLDPSELSLDCTFAPTQKGVPRSGHNPYRFFES